jgi:hypothetical protein
MKLRRGDGVEHLPDMIVAGDALEAEEGAGVVAALDLLQVLLKAEERGALGEEDGEGREGDVGQGVEPVLAGAPVGQVREDRVPAFEERFEAARVHAR